MTGYEFYMKLYSKEKSEHRTYKDHWIRRPIPQIQKDKKTKKKQTTDSYQQEKLTA